MSGVYGINAMLRRRVAERLGHMVEAVQLAAARLANERALLRRQLEYARRVGAVAGDELEQRAKDALEATLAQLIAPPLEAAAPSKVGELEAQLVGLLGLGLDVDLRAERVRVSAVLGHTVYLGDGARCGPLLDALRAAVLALAPLSRVSSVQQEADERTLDGIVSTYLGVTPDEAAALRRAEMRADREAGEAMRAAAAGVLKAAAGPTSEECASCGYAPCMCDQA